MKKVDEGGDDLPAADEDKEIHSEKEIDDDESEEDDQPELPSGLTGENLSLFHLK